MPSLTQLFATSLDGADWLQVLAGDASLLHALDAFLARACAAQSKRLDVHVLSHEELQDLQDDARVAFALYMRLLSALETPPLARSARDSMRMTLLHVARVVPFGQLFGLRNPQRIRTLLDGAVASVDDFKADLTRLSGVYAKHLEQVHAATLQNRRGQVVDLSQSIYETSLSIHALSLSPAVVDVLFGHTEDATLAAGSLVRALAVCYEADIPVLQRNLSKLDETAQKKAALLIPESRRLLLRVLDIVFHAAMTREKAAAGTGEGVLTIIHELSHSTDAETADHGSFISDLWHLCSYEAKLLEYFDEIKLDRDSVSYLEVILDGLPRRRVLAETAAYEPAKTDPVEAPTRASAPPPLEVPASERPASNELTPLISQVQDLFPDLGDGYVALCLLNSQNELETVINYLLESNPPPALSSIRQDLKRSDDEYAALERSVLGKEPLVSAASAKSEKVDPSRIWKGKRSQEKHYDPQVARKDPSVVEKVMAMVDEYAEEDSFREAARLQAGSAKSRADAAAGESESGIVLDEYDDDYNDEFEDYEPFSVHDGGQAEDLEAIRRQNRRLRELEAEDAFWEDMRNQNRRAVDMEEDEGEKDEEDEEESRQQGASLWARGPARGEWKPQAGGQDNKGPRGPPRRGGANGDGAQATGPPSAQNVQRQRQRDNKNKAKVGNHHRKDRALKKRG